MIGTLLLWLLFWSIPGLILYGVVLFTDGGQAVKNTIRDDGWLHFIKISLFIILVWPWALLRMF